MRSTGRSCSSFPPTVPTAGSSGPSSRPQQYQRYSRAKGLVVAALDGMPDDIRQYLGASQVRIAGEGEIKQGTIPLLYVSQERGGEDDGRAGHRHPAGRRGEADHREGVVRGRSRRRRRDGTWWRSSRAPIRCSSTSTSPSARTPITTGCARRRWITIRSAPSTPSCARPARRTARSRRVRRRRTASPRSGRRSRRSTTARPDSIMNGADDDGTGSMGLLELVEYFTSRTRPGARCCSCGTPPRRRDSSGASGTPTIPRCRATRSWRRSTST